MQSVPVRNALDEQFIGTVDVWQLRQLRSPIMRALAPGYIDHLELNRHLKKLIATGVWRRVRAVPHEDPSHRYSHIYDLYGQSRA